MDQQAFHRAHQRQTEELLAQANDTYSALAGRGKRVVEVRVGDVRASTRKARDTAGETVDEAAEAVQPLVDQAQEAVTEPYLKDILAAYNSAPYVSQWLDTVYGQNVGNALNVAVVDLLAGKSDPEQLVEAVDAAAAKA